MMTPEDRKALQTAIDYFGAEGHTVVAFILFEEPDHYSIVYRWDDPAERQKVRELINAPENLSAHDLTPQ